jgi:hypothetical protein
MIAIEIVDAENSVFGVFYAKSEYAAELASMVLRTYSTKFSEAEISAVNKFVSANLFGCVVTDNDILSVKISATENSAFQRMLIFQRGEVDKDSVVRPYWADL